MSRAPKTVLALSLTILIALSFAPLAFSGTSGGQVPPGWTKIATGGLGQPENMMMFGSSEFGGKLFFWIPGAGGSGSPAAPVWTWDGSRFAKAAPDGFGDAGNISLTPGVVFQGQYYIGTGHGSGTGQLWRTPDGSHWERVGETAFTDPNDSNCWPMGVQDGKLLIGFDNYNTGVQVFSYDGSTFTRANNDGFDENAYAMSSAVVYNGRVNVVIQRMDALHNQIPVIPMVYMGGTTWTNTGEKGFGDTGNIGCYVTFTDGAGIYAGTWNPAGGQLWRFDGSAWAKINLGAIPSPTNNMVLGFPWQGQLFVATSNQTTGPPMGPATLYKQKAGGTFQAITEDGFGDPNNMITFVSAVYKGKFIAGTFNTAGFQVWTGSAGPGITGISPTSGPYGTEVTITGDGFGSLPSGAGCGSAWCVSCCGADVPASQVISWTNNKIVLRMPEGACAGDVCVMTPAGTSNAVTFTPTLSNTYYFPEGSTRDDAVDGKFDEYLCVMNPGTAQAKVTVSYLLAGGANPETKDYAVAGRSRLTIDVAAEIGRGRDVATVVQGDRPIVAERTMYFNYHGKWNGGDAVAGASSPSEHWYFAEGSTRNNARDGSFEEWLCLMNPDGRAATATINYTGDVTKQVSVVVPAGGRVTRDVASDVGIDRDVSVSVASDVGIVAERPIYFNYHGNCPGGDSTIGATYPAQDFYFAEGATYEWASEWICVANPNPVNANVKVYYAISGGGTAQKNIVVGPNARQTLNVAAAVGWDKDVSVRLHSDLPVVAERSMYFDYGGGSWPGGAIATGAPAPRNTYYFAEGTTRQNAVDGSFDEWVSIENPNGKDVNIKLSFLKPDGITLVQNVVVPKSTRSTISVNALLGPDLDSSLVLEASDPVVVERPMYFNYRGFAQGGSVSRGYGL